jgi:ribosomal-protein-alanine N-acetyltransferase
VTPDLTLHIDSGFLRPLVESDVHYEYVNGLNNPLVNRYLDAVKAEVQTLESVTKFVKMNRLSSDSVLWGIWVGQSKEHIGTVRLHGIENRHGTAHIGICIFNMQFWRMGIGPSSIRSVTAWAISTFGLRWIEAGAYAANKASQQAFLSAGYRWVFDIPYKYLLEGKPEVVKVFAKYG